MLHIYYGVAKGKSTAAIGLACRMIGAGKRVQMIQFLKDGDSSEVKILKAMGVDVLYKKMPTTFVDFSNPQMIKDVSVLETALFEQVDESYDCIILDELLDVITLSFINEEMVYRMIKKHKDNCEIVMTGRQPTHKFRQLADYLTEMKKHKHPYDLGIKGRKGIEF